MVQSANVRCRLLLVSSDIYCYIVIYVIHVFANKMFVKPSVKNGCSITNNNLINLNLNINIKQTESKPE